MRSLRSWRPLVIGFGLAVEGGCADPGPPGPVAAVTVSPGTATISTDVAQQFAAALKDARGNTLTGRTVVWWTQDAGQASISQSGLARGMIVGQTVVIAMSEGVLGSATLIVTAGAPRRLKLATSAAGAVSGDPSPRSRWSS